MNKRIRELAEQAEMSANCGDHVEVTLMMQTFADLIVQECLSIVHDELRYIINWETAVNCALDGDNCTMNEEQGK